MPRIHATLAAIVLMGVLSAYGPATAQTAAPGSLPKASPPPPPASAGVAGPPTAADTVLSDLRREALACWPLARTPLGRAFVGAAKQLPKPAARVLWTDSARTGWWTEAEARARPDSQRARLIRRELGPGFFYNTRYGTPIAYLRPMEILGARGVQSLAGARLLDYGCGNIAHLRLMAIGGARATGVDIDPVLRALYGDDGDQGPIGDGTVDLVIGSFPGDSATSRSVGGGYRVIMSKNTLKKGYIHPDTVIDARQRVNLGVDEGAFLRAIRDRLDPGGWFLIYNLAYGPKRKEGRYDPSADAASPWTKAQLEAAGFEVTTVDAPDDLAVREMARAVGWDQPQGGMQLQQLTALYTLARKPERAAK